MQQGCERAPPPRDGCSSTEPSSKGTLTEKRRGAKVFQRGTHVCRELFALRFRKQILPWPSCDQVAFLFLFLIQENSHPPPTPRNPDWLGNHGCHDTPNLESTGLGKASGCTSQGFSGCFWTYRKVLRDLAGIETGYNSNKSQKNQLIYWFVYCCIPFLSPQRLMHKKRVAFNQGIPIKPVKINGADFFSSKKSEEQIKRTPSQDCTPGTVTICEGFQTPILGKGSHQKCGFDTFRQT